MSELLCKSKRKLKTNNSNHSSFLDCNICYDDIFAAATDCIISFDWQNCIFDILGAGNPCAECVCDVISDIGNLFGQDWHC